MTPASRQRNRRLHRLSRKRRTDPCQAKSRLRRMWAIASGARRNSAAVNEDKHDRPRRMRRGRSCVRDTNTAPRRAISGERRRVQESKASARPSERRRWTP